MTIRIADFQCEDCGNVSELVFKTDSEDPKICKHCGSSDTTRLIGAPKIVDGVKSLGRRTPDGFKDVLRQIDKTTPQHFKEAKFSAL